MAAFRVHCAQVSGRSRASRIRAERTARRHGTLETSDCRGARRERCRGVPVRFSPH
jgi:hypothetical protein